MAWMTDMTHFLDEKGRIPEMPAPAARLAGYFGAIVTAAFDPDSARVPCRRRPGHRICRGVIMTDLQPDTNDVGWHCPECGDEGLIHHWEGTPWDRSLSN